ncbi:MAG: hypothetical protein QF797_11895 [Alphaproteobacteria bacterium]|jgi:hypothetical protein|nr:hypothetical protein [Alphaproteobacteria bacterium]
MTQSYESQAKSDGNAELIDALFAIGPEVRYVALGRGQEVTMQLASDVATETTFESNRFEELLVNPTLLTLAGQRERLDCGGLDFLVVGYGAFQQLVMPMQDGHVSIALVPDVPAKPFVEGVKTVLAKYHLEAQFPA